MNNALRRQERTTTNHHVSCQSESQCIPAPQGEAKVCWHKCNLKNSRLLIAQNPQQKFGIDSYPFMEEGKFLTKKLLPDILHIKSQQTPTVKVFQATLSIHRLITSSKSPSQQKLAWRTDILRNRSIGHLWCILWLWKIPEHVLVFLFIRILKTVYLQQLSFPLLGFLCSL